MPAAIGAASGARARSQSRCEHHKKTAVELHHPPSLFSPRPPPPASQFTHKSQLSLWTFRQISSRRVAHEEYDLNESFVARHNGDDTFSLAVA
jgi:hypothetical protein